MHSDLGRATREHVGGESPEDRGQDHLVARQPGRSLTVTFTELLEAFEEFGVSGRGEARAAPSVIFLGVDRDEERRRSLERTEAHWIVGRRTSSTTTQAKEHRSARQRLQARARSK